jgi:hypothetical protein
MRIREAQKNTDPMDLGPDADPDIDPYQEHCFSYWYNHVDCHHQPKIKRMEKWRRREDSKLTFMPILAEEVLMGEVSDVW